MRVGLIQFRPYMAEALKEHLSDSEIEVVVFHTAGLRVDHEKLKSLSAPDIVRAIRAAPHCDIHLVGAFVWPALTAALLSFLPDFRFGVEIGGSVRDAIHYHGGTGPLKPLRKVLFPLVFKLIFSRADLIICNSMSLAGITAGTYPGQKDKILAIYEGINYHLIEACPGGEPEARILSVSNANAPTKLPGLYTVIEAFELVAAGHPEMSLVCAVSAGSGKAWERFLKLKERAAQSPFGDRITVEANVKNMSGLFSGSYMMVYSTPTDTSDGLPRAIVEAQAFGLPVVAGDTDGCPEAVDSGVSGLIVKNTAEALASGAETLINDRRLRDAMSAAGPRWVKSRFSWEKIAGDYRNLLLKKYGWEKH